MVFRRGGEFDRSAIPRGIVAFTNKRKISWLDDGVLRSRYCIFLNLGFADHSQPGLALGVVLDSSVRPHRRHHEMGVARIAKVVDSSRSYVRCGSRHGAN